MADGITVFSVTHKLDAETILEYARAITPKKPWKLALKNTAGTEFYFNVVHVIPVIDEPDEFIFIGNTHGLRRTRRGKITWNVRQRSGFMESRAP